MSDTGEWLAQWMREHVGRYAYSQTGNRLEPDNGGETDCSALVRYAYQQIAGIEVGTWTGSQQDYGRQIFGTECESLDEALSLLAPGDLIFFNWSEHNPTWDHVEMYIGGGQTCGHGGEPYYGPVVKSLASQWNAAYEVCARRYLDANNTNASGSGERATAAGGAPGLGAFPLPKNEYFGLITGGDESHGGFFDWEKPHVKRIQQRLIAKGYVPGVSDIHSDWADGVYEQPTADAVERFQRAEMPGTTFFGQVWWDDWAQLDR